MMRHVQLDAAAPNPSDLGAQRREAVVSDRLFGVLALAAIAVEMALLAAWQSNGYWDFSDGAYALTARELLHGVHLYSGVAAAQPPPVYLVGALLLWLHDGLGPIRAGMALADLATAALVGVAVWRLCGRRWVSLGAALVAPLLPISLHEHAQLTPETLAAPLLLAMAIWSARRPALSGVIGALAVACKLPFVLPAVAIAIAARRRVLVWLVVFSAALAGLGLAIFGGALWDGAVRAQFEVGHNTLHYVGGLFAQGAWNEAPLVCLAALALVLGRRESGDSTLLRTLAVAALASLVLLASVYKRGSYINVLAVAEPPLLALAAAGAFWAWQRSRARALVLVAGALVGAQSISLLAAPGDPAIATRPFARSGLERALSPAAVARAVAVARACPPGLAYSGSPYIAFLADRRMPGDQADTFIIRYASTDAPERARAQLDEPRCPS
jgi:hypothetical protein